MLLNSTSPAVHTASLADRVDLIAADAHEAGLDQAVVILAHMAGLLRAVLNEGQAVPVENVQALAA